MPQIIHRRPLLSALRFLRLVLTCRKRKRERHALVGVALHSYSATVLAEDLIRNGESRSGTAFFRRIKRIEDLIQLSLGDSPTLVADLS